MDIAVSGGHGLAVPPDIAEFVQRPTACRIARIHLLGPMRATSYLGDDILPRGKKARAMLAYLCVAFGARAPRMRLARLLWDEVGDELARGSMRHALADVCSAMGPFAEELMSTGRASIRLNADACWIDAVALVDSFDSDLAVFCTGKLLEGFDGISASFDTWLARERARFNWKTRGLLRPQASRTSPNIQRYVPPRSFAHTETSA